MGGPDGELGASLRYLNQRYSAPWNEIKGVLTDIGISVPEMLHFEPSGNRNISETEVAISVPEMFRIVELSKKTIICGLPLFSFKNSEQIKKWDDNSSEDKPFKVQKSKRTRYIDVYASVAMC